MTVISGLFEAAGWALVYFVGIVCAYFVIGFLLYQATRLVTYAFLVTWYSFHNQVTTFEKKEEQDEQTRP